MALTDTDFKAIWEDKKRIRGDIHWKPNIEGSADGGQDPCPTQRRQRL